MVWERLSLETLGKIFRFQENFEKGRGEICMLRNLKIAMVSTRARNNIFLSYFKFPA